MGTNTWLSPRVLVRERRAACRQELQPSLRLLGEACRGGQRNSQVMAELTCVLGLEGPKPLREASCSPMCLSPPGAGLLGPLAFPLVLSTFCPLGPSSRSFPPAGPSSCPPHQGPLAHSPDPPLCFADGPCPMDSPTTEEASGARDPWDCPQKAHSPHWGHTCAVLVWGQMTRPAYTSALKPWTAVGKTPSGRAHSQVQVAEGRGQARGFLKAVRG